MLDKRIAIGTTLVAVVVAGNAWLEYRTVIRLSAARDLVTHTHEVDAALERVMSSITDAETGERGYLISGDERYLEPYVNAEQRVAGDVAHVDSLTTNDRVEQASLPILRERIKDRLELLRLAIAVRRESGIEPARALLLTDRGKAAMDSIRVLVDRMQDRQRRLLAQRAPEYAQDRNNATASALIAGAIALMLIAGLGMALSEYSMARDQGTRKLDEQRELLRMTLASIGDAVIATDTAGHVSFLNPVAETLTGFLAREAIGKPLESIFVIVNESTRNTAENPALRALREGAYVGSANYSVLIGRNGRETPIDDSASPILDAEGHVTGVVLVFRDITERRRADNAQREADRRKDEFLAMLAHELRNPLAPLRHALEVQRLIPGDAAVMSETRALMERQVEQLVRLTDDLLDVSRISQDRIELRRETVELQSVIRSAVETSNPDLTRRGHHLTLDLPDRPIIVDGDPARLAQILYNLLGNAAKYTDPGGSIHISAELGHQNAIVKVRDNGIGIRPEVIDRIFDVFAQADRTSPQSQGGLGLGLTIVRRLVALHGGTITARSDGYQKGSEFVLTLPLKTAMNTPLSVRSVPGTVEPAKTNRRRRVVLADDNKDAADSLAQVLTKLGHTVHVCYDGEAAIAMTEDVRPDALLLDVGMPKHSGYEVARRVRAESWGKEIIVAAITGWGQPSDRRRSAEAGFDEHFVKPVDLGALEALLESR